MSAQTQTRQKTVKDIAAAKGGDPLVCLTAYTAPMAELLDPHCDLLLVGDSVGMVVHGLPLNCGRHTRYDDPAWAGRDAQSQTSHGRRRHAVRIL